MTPTNGNDEENRHSPPTGDRAAAIARRAYEKWQARGCPDGDDRKDWYEAEQELLAASAAPSAPQPKAKNGSRPQNRSATS